MNILRVSTVAMAFLLCFANLGAAREKKDFNNYLKNVEKIVDQYSTDKYFENHEFTNKKTSENKKFADFSEMERAIMKIFHGQTLGTDLGDTQEKWKEELKNAEETPDSEDEASKKDVEEFSKKLFELRQKNAVKLEGLAAELFKKYPDKFTNDEKEFFMKTIKTYNDKNKLIKRDK
jgi:hypothetical protein